ncbi:TetR/AcrR family transcriptional regulator [Prauserella muralis]|uniref:TetR family transcriptional regulator n=1 Tax=Prauserella muralis TaxID=588067 RepID=A0A2V4BK55_9PSEU|nr:TetR/AcrR family transcriptional regulator [Prauserella muralis]PXY31073.1 TetR family transcriptional regulator [Prauserella muralis]TWE14647.1 TetR family transcriptional regulator [Prauserella muralis]
MSTAPQARTTRRGRPGYDLESVLRIAVKLFNERGYDGTSMEDLARRLGITKSAIYHHVPSKQELLRLAVDRALDGLFAVAEEAKAVDGRAVEQLEFLVRGSVGVLVERLPFVTLLLRVRGNTKVERSALARRREFDRIVAELVARAETEGDIRPDVDPAVTARLLFGMVNSLIEWYRPRKGDTDIADVVAKIAFDGIRLRS